MFAKTKKGLGLRKLSRPNKRQKKTPAFAGQARSAAGGCFDKFEEPKAQNAGTSERSTNCDNGTKIGENAGSLKAFENQASANFDGVSSETKSLTQEKTRFDSGQEKDSLC